MEKTDLRGGTRNMCSAREVLLKGPKYSLSTSVKSHDHLPQCPGVYAIWEGEELLYVGHAGTSQPSRPGALCGLKDRLDSHWNGTLTSSSLAMALWFLKIAPASGGDINVKIAEFKLSPSSKTKEYIRRLEYSFVETGTKEEALALERAVHAQNQPPLNNFKRFM